MSQRVAKSAGQSYSDVTEKHANEDTRNADAIRLRAKVGVDPLKDIEKKLFEAAKTGKR